MRKSDVLSIVADPTRNRILRRLEEAEKAAYSDLLDTAENARHLTSTGNFNYHLHFLLENQVISKEGTVYKLTKKGREITKFLKDIDQMWSKIEPTLRGEKMSTSGWAERYEEETGTKMQKTSSKLHGIDLILDERKVIGLISQEDCKAGFFKDYEPLRAEDCTLSVRRSEKEDKKCTELLIGHPDIKYYISPQLLSRVYEFLSIHFNEVHVYGVKKKPFPFLLRATELGKDYDGCAFLVAPVVF